jgi:hypothetical protein
MSAGLRLVLRQQLGLHHRIDGVGAIENIRLWPPRPRLVDDLQRNVRVGLARIVYLDARIFLLERIDHWPDDLVHDQRAVPDNMAFLLRRGDQRIIRPRAGCQRQQGQKPNENSHRNTS